MIDFKNVSYTYPFQTEKALDGVSFFIKKGEAILCTGPSGCGKSTIIRLINGLVPHYFKGAFEGRVMISGKDNADRKIHEISRHVGTLFQDPEHQFFALNVADELAFALECQGIEAGIIHKTIRSESKRFKLDNIMDAAIFDLSEGEKQKVALASVLAQHPETIILDEPTANLDPLATQELSEILKQLKKEGMTIFIADHRLYWLKDVIDRVVIFDEGKMCETGTFSMLESGVVQKKYGLRKTSLHPLEQTLLKVDHKSKDGICINGMTFSHKNRSPLFRDESTCLPRGKVTAVTGKNGTGKTTFARLLTGLTPLKSGKISINGNFVPPKTLLKKGSIILQNTDHQLHMKTVRLELEVSGKNLEKGEREKEVDRLLKSFNLDTFSRRHPQSLSGGQKQRLVIACGIIKKPEILIMDEPTSGLDGINMRVISRVIQDLANQGTCVIVISHDLELIVESCSHILTLPFQKNKNLFTKVQSF